jgi:hypothetical protein
MVQLEDKDLFQILIAEFRYAVRRDNHLAPDTCVQHVKTYIPEMSEQWRTHTAKQLSEEIIDERLWNSRFFDPEFKFESNIQMLLDDPDNTKKQLDNDYVWEDLLVFLANHLDSLPYNTDRYMEHIRSHMTYSDGIDYYSEDIQNKILANKNKQKTVKNI